MPTPSFTAIYHSEQNTLEFFFNNHPNIVAVDRVQTVLIESKSTHHLLLDDLTWHHGLFYGRDTFTFDTPLCSTHQNRRLRSGHLRWWCRMTVHVLSDDALAQHFSLDQSLQADNCPVVTLPPQEEFLVLLSVGDALLCGCYVLKGALPSPYRDADQHVPTPAPVLRRRVAAPSTPILDPFVLSAVFLASV